MKAQLWTYINCRIAQVQNVELPDNYDGDPFGDTVPFAVGSNQVLVIDTDFFKNTEDKDENSDL